ncbi:hotdog fold thioesterase [Cryobacterium breve]|jgi:1,4-dihydroxy-2-naphthoyl-CoA hydrolase|uniref:Hotdog fold thioesterase n=1 Tax=Cryobacterium breve TaxID=1259258 RepID=A0ABY7NBA4_9MICO|nr:hotdog fold thioesterase [Cryobacterium breve]WBM79555.1 hotdog fold thioesterase [Cryobacterium breve]
MTHDTATTAPAPTPSIWHGDVSLRVLENMGRRCLIETLGIELTDIAPDALRGRMPVDTRTTQPAGVLHGGASVAFAETLTSIAGYLAIDRHLFHVVGMEINANHLRPVASGWVTGVARPIHLGARAQVWEVKISDDRERLVCVSRCTLAVIERPSDYVSPELRRSRSGSPN